MENYKNCTKSKSFVSVFFKTPLKICNKWGEAAGISVGNRVFFYTTGFIDDLFPEKKKSPDEHQYAHYYYSPEQVKESSICINSNLARKVVDINSTNDNKCSHQCQLPGIQPVTDIAFYVLNNYCA